MSRTVDEVVDLIRNPPPALKRPQPVSDLEVRGQRERYNPATWLRHWEVTGKPLPPSLDPVAPPRTISRQELFDQAKHLDNEDQALDLYVRVCGWGAGTGGRNVVRCGKPLADEDLAAKLLEAHRIATNEGATDAYRYMLRRNPGWVRGLGPAYFSKWLYFTTYDSWKGPGPAPLIFDKNVAKGLGLRSTAGWPPSDYAAYLETVEQVRARFDDASSRCIEHALFTIGRALP